MFDQISRTKVERRHWCPRSEQYAGGDVLYNHLNNGWHVVQGAVVREYVWQGGMRQVVIFHFELQKEKQIVQLSVIQNPFVERLIAAKHLCIVDTPTQRSSKNVLVRSAEK